MNQIDQLISQAGIQGTFDLRCLYRGGFRLPHEQSPAGVMPFHLLMKGEIRVTTAQGDDVTLRPGDAFVSPGDAVGFRIMAQAGVLPEEIELKKQVAVQRAHLATLTDEAERKAAMAVLAQLEMRQAIAEEARRKFLR